MLYDLSRAGTQFRPLPCVAKSARIIEPWKSNKETGRFMPNSTRLAITSRGISTRAARVLCRFAEPERRAQGNVGIDGNLQHIHSDIDAYDQPAAEPITKNLLGFHRIIGSALAETELLQKYLGAGYVVISRVRTREIHADTLLCV
jgi:hypothetical protein